jgi:two-component system, chemotaxis family, protein-glutamate methylesterase/glutaminase
VHFNRPSVDILFKSVGAAYGARALAVILTGSGNDGADGVRAVKEAGGVTIVQDPREAEHRGMPQAAWATGRADHRLPLAEIPAAIVSLVRDGEIVPRQVQA